MAKPNFSITAAAPISPYHRHHHYAESKKMEGSMVVMIATKIMELIVRKLLPRHVGMFVEKLSKLVLE